ncbi:hypothetical protein U9M48_001572 [Paspalum notatum var. saurae]|uniref:Uncharacterized protein n=1 Tax=Paspalum notatum var. saurae TaxID=547442 RepID=A0AAQ3PII3_PASNO
MSEGTHGPSSCTHHALDDDANDAVKVRFELAVVLNLADERIASAHNFCTFSARNKAKGFTFVEGMEPMSSPLLAFCFHVRCDMAVVQGINASWRRPAPEPWRRPPSEPGGRGHDVRGWRR